MAESGNNNSNDMMTFGGHLEVFRRMLLRVLAVTFVLSIVIFCFKGPVFEMLMAPSHWNFITYEWIEKIIQNTNADFSFSEFHVNLIATDLSSQFMTHISTSFYLGLLGASPYLLFELFRFISPALYQAEKKVAVKISAIAYLLFLFGVLMTYFILFPVSFRFLGTYSVSSEVVSNITIDSYISTFLSLTLVMGIVFQLPVLAYFLAHMRVVKYNLLSKYRKHALIILMLVAAIITPPDILTLILVTVPLYLLFEFSIKVVKWKQKNN